GTNSEVVNAVTADNSGNVYVTGIFNGSAAPDAFSQPQNFPVTFGNITFNSHGGSDIYVAKYDSLGALVWVRQAGGSAIDGPFVPIPSDSGDRIAVDAA